MATASSSKKILVVDDDPAIRQLIYRFLDQSDYDMESAQDAKTARLVFKQFNPDLVILDVNLPDGSGYNLCAEMRSQTDVLVLMLTCLTDAEDVIEGFNRGADDYLTKPFHLQILKARIQALFNRRLPKKLNHQHQKGLIFGQLAIDTARCEVTLNSQKVALTALEYDLLHFLASQPNQVWERRKLIQEVWGEDYVGDERKVDVHIGQIRRKIGDSKGKLIKTIRGKGYRFEAPEKAEGNGQFLH